MTPIVRYSYALLLLAGACELTTSTDEDDRTGNAAGSRDGGERGTAVPVEASTATSDAAVAAVSDASTTAGDATSAGNAPPTPTGVAPTASGGPLPAGFDHSNIPAGTVLTKHEALSLSHGVDVDTDQLAFSGVWADTSFKPELVKTADGELAVLYVESFTTTTGGGIEVTGTRPFVLIAATTIDHAGWITSVPSDNNGYAAGGAPGASTPERRGFGPGGGAAGSDSLSGAGGSFCGLGGVPMGGTPAPAYGNPALIPLVGGSSGGSAASTSAAAGGALQLVAGTSLLIRETGGISMPGRGAANRAGGSSGGAILLEAPSVSVLGVLAANGASGGSEVWEGTDGTVTNTSAPGHDETLGAGSAGMLINGGDGTGPLAAGGGGAGRIRINGGQIMLGANAVVTPSKGTPCYSEGAL